MAEALSFGCRLNAAEADTMAALAARAGWAGALVVNTCAVTAEAEAQARQAIRRAHREDPARPILVTGCAAQIAPAAWAALPGVARVIGNGRKLDPTSWDAPPAPITAADPVVPAASGGARAFLAVQQGCDHACTFCIIPRGRGPARALPAREAAEAAARLAERHAEVVLTGVDLASHPDLPGLVRAVLRGAPGLRRLRLSSLDPAALDDRFWALWAEEERLAPFLHLSLQHADDLVLKRMRRRHDHAGLQRLLARARDARPGAALGGDLIAGFPTETEAQHRWLESFVREAGFAFLHVFPFSPRAGTPAARMPQHPPALVRERAARLRALGAASRARFLEGRLGRVEEVATEAGGSGTTAHGARMRLPAPPGLFVRARAAATDGLTLSGDLC